jgi:hypothetical protein
MRGASCHSIGGRCRHHRARRGGGGVTRRCVSVRHHRTAAHFEKGSYPKADDPHDDEPDWIYRRHGHTERMTQAVYGRVTDDRLTAAAEVFSRAIGQS